MKIKIRDYLPEDAEFVASSWLKSNKGSPLSFFLPDEIYQIEQERIILALLESGAKTKIAHLPEEPDCILSYVVWSKLDNKNVIHYIYTKFINRQHSIAQQLLSELKIGKTIYCTSLPKTDLLKKLKKKFVIKRLPLVLFGV